MRYLTILTILFSFATAGAQDLVELMPRDTVLALGIRGGAEVVDEFPELLAQWQDLGVFEALLAVSDINLEEDQQAEGLYNGMSELGLLNEEAWISLSASSNNPLPAVLLLSRIADAQEAKVIDLLASADVAETLEEGGVTFYQLDSQDADVDIFFAFENNVLILSTQPDVLRGGLRQLAGRDSDSSFVSTRGYLQTLGTVDLPANVYSYVDYDQAGKLLRPYALGFGVNELVDRLSASLETLGVSAGYARLLERGSERVWQSNGIQVLDATADRDLYNLIVETDTLDLNTLQFMPQDALSYNHNLTDLPAWWDYLDDVAESVPFFDGGLDDTIELFLNVSPKNKLFSWMGSQATSIVLEPAEVTTPGVPAENLLGEMVYVVSVENKRAAKTRFPDFLDDLSSNLSMFTDPLGRGGVQNSQELDIQGVESRLYDISNGITVAYAFVDDYLLIGTSQEALERALQAFQGTNLATELDISKLPEQITAFGYSDAVATMRSTSEQIASQLQTMAGITGSVDLDVDKIEEATGRLQQFFDTLSDKLGDNVSYSYIEDGVIYQESTTVLK